jgi:tetratricopeptide (TPR) repeat protein
MGLSGTWVVGNPDSGLPEAKRREPTMPEKQRLSLLARKGWPEEQVGDYDQVFDRLQREALQRIEKLEAERDLAPSLAEELLHAPSAERRRRVQEDARFHSAALADLLLERCSMLSPGDLDVEEIPRLALDIAEQLAHGPGSHGLANDLRARAWANLGNAYRIRSDFRAAEVALSTAESCLEEGSGDPLERARVLDFKASLLRAQRRFEPALATIDQAISIHRRLHDRHREGRALISKAMIHGYAGEQEKGIPLFSRALQLIDANREPHLALAATNNLLVDLTDLGRFEEASALLPAVHARLRESGSPSDRTRVCWAEARLDAGLGRTAEAGAKLRDVRDEFISQGIGYNAALAALDLARLYLEQGRTAETRQLAAEMHTIFVSREIHREALVALVFFQKAAEQERATVRLVEEISSYLKRAHGNPGLPFEKPA